MDTLSLPPQPRGDVEGVPFRQARNYHASARPTVLWVVLHTAKVTQVKHAAEDLAAWAAGAKAPQASWHFSVDCGGVTQSVLEKDVAWHAPGGSSLSIGIVHALKENQTWQDYLSIAMLIRSAELVAGICRRWRIPVQRLGVPHILEGVAGICGHRDIAEAFEKSKHTDPGESFPWESYLDEVRRIYREVGDTLPPGGLHV